MNTETMREYVGMAAVGKLYTDNGSSEKKLLIMNIKLLINIQSLILMILVLVNMDV